VRHYRGGGIVGRESCGLLELREGFVVAAELREDVPRL